MTMNKDGVSLLSVHAERLMITLPDGTVLDPKIGEPYASKVIEAYDADRRATAVVTEEMVELAVKAWSDHPPTRIEPGIGAIHDSAIVMRAVLEAALSVRAEPVAVKPEEAAWLDTHLAELRTTPNRFKDEIAHLERIRSTLVALEAALSVRAEPAADSPTAIIGYTNWRGEYAAREIVPMRPWFGSTDWHPEPQWLLKAWDVSKDAERDFSIKDIGFRASPVPSIPAGYRLVPEEPTEGMVLAGYANCKGAGNIKGVYAAMLAAAPAQQQEGDGE